MLTFCTVPYLPKEDRVIYRRPSTCAYLLWWSETGYEPGELTVLVCTYGTDLMQWRTRDWHALESNPLSTEILSIYHRVRVDVLMKYAQRKHSQQALTE